MKDYKINKYIFIPVSAVILVGVIFLVLTEIKKTENTESKAATSSIPARVFHAPDIQAKAAFVLDAKTGETIYENNAGTILPLASITKLMTALVSSENIASTTVITITGEDLKQDGDNGLLLGEKWRFDDLRDFTLLVSSNDGAEAIGGNFIEKMNEKATSLGLHTLSFKNPSGLDVSPAEPSNFGSARDVSELFKYILENRQDILEITKHPSFRFVSKSGLVHYSQNTDTVVGKIPGLFASKTGYTDLAGGNLIVGIDEDINHPIIITVLGSSENGRFDDVVALASSTREYFSQ